MAERVPHLYPSEPVAVQFMNTVWADREGLHDSLDTVDHLRDWLGLSGLPGSPQLERADVASFRRLRDALRRVAAEVTGDDRRSAASPLTDLESAIAEINRAAAPSAPVLASTDHTMTLTWHTQASGPALTRSLIAVEAAGLLTGDPLQLGACHGPGCVLYFAKDRPRREWCSAACGNRARVARHYEKTRGRRSGRDA